MIDVVSIKQNRKLAKIHQNYKKKMGRCKANVETGGEKQFTVLPRLYKDTANDLLGGIVSLVSAPFYK